jgi:alkylated DNA repair dioxygenase AlkB
MSFPFTYHPNVFTGITFDNIVDEFTPYLTQAIISLPNGKTYMERRITSWISNHGHNFRYSNKVMTSPVGQMPPITESIRYRLGELLDVSFDSVLLNIYMDGKSGMHYHSDPLYDEWQSEAAVVSFGDTRELVFREIANKDNKYSFPMNNGDVMFMFGDCQTEYEHCLKTMKDAESAGPRLSLVFKKHI